MQIKKEAGLGRGPQVDQRELEQIHQFSRKELTAEEVYTFSVRLCDNEIDRDGERFSPPGPGDAGGKVRGEKRHL